MIEADESDRIGSGRIGADSGTESFVSGVECNDLSEWMMLSSLICSGTARDSPLCFFPLARLAFVSLALCAASLVAFSVFILPSFSPSS